MRVLLAAGVLLIAAHPSTADEAESALAEGDAARDRGDRAAAERAYTRAIEAAPGMGAGWHRRAMVRRLGGEFLDAIADLRRAAEIAPEDPSIRHDLGLTLLDSGDLAASLAEYDEALRLAPDSARTWNNRAYAKRLSGDDAGALEDITMAIQLDRRYGRAYRHRALTLFNLGEWEDALADFEEAVRLEPGEQDHAHLRMWILRVRLGKREVADEKLRAWVKEAKGFTAAAGRYLLGELTRDELLEAAGGEDARAAAVRRCEALFLSGVRALVDGDQEAAKKELEAAKTVECDRTEVTRSVEAELVRLGR
jgi:tetratricopeptide (TPR) repeat protein